MERENDGKKTIKSSAFSISINIISTIVSLIVMSLLTNLMIPQDMGLATSFITLQIVISYIVLLAIFTSINRALLEKNINFDEFLSTITIFSIVSVLIYFFVYLLFKDSLNKLLGYDTYLIMFLLIIVLFDNIILFLYTKWSFKNEYIKCFIYNLMVSPVSQIVSLLLVWIFISNKYASRIIGLKIIPIILGIIATIHILIKGKFRFNKQYLKYALLISFPTMWHLLSQILLSNSDLLMIKGICGAEDAGIYSIAYTISNVFFMAIVSILKSWSPWVYRRLKSNEYTAIFKNSKFIIMLSFVLCFGLITIAPEMIKLFLNKAYINSIYIISPLCIGMFFQVIYVLFYDVEYYHKANKQIAFYSIIAAILNIILNFIFISKYGYQAAAYTTLVSYALLAGLHFNGMKKIDSNKIFDIDKIIFYSIVLIINSFISYIFIENFIIRYIIMIAVFILILILNYNEIKSFIKIFLNKNN